MQAFARAAIWLMPRVILAGMVGSTSSLKLVLGAVLPPGLVILDAFISSAYRDEVQ